MRSLSSEHEQPRPNSEILRTPPRCARGFSRAFGSRHRRTRTLGLMKYLVHMLLVFLGTHVHACEIELAGNYFLKNRNGELAESLQLREENGQLAAYTRGQAGWELNPQQPEPYSAAAFSEFTKQSAPSGYCGILVSGAILARVATGWQWAGLKSKTGIVIISIAGPREAVRN
jgi:hypothetical protein